MAVGIERVIASLPPEGVGAAVNILDVCEDEVRMLLSHPERCVLVEGGGTSRSDTRAKVQVKSGGWGGCLGPLSV